MDSMLIRKPDSKPIVAIINVPLENNEDNEDEKSFKFAIKLQDEDHCDILNDMNFDSICGLINDVLVEDLGLDAMDDGPELCHSHDADTYKGEIHLDLTAPYVAYFDQWNGETCYYIGVDVVFESEEDFNAHEVENFKYILDSLENVTKIKLVRKNTYILGENYIEAKSIH